MSLDTKRVLCDEILIELYGGQYSNDAAISLRFVLRKVNDKIGAMAVQSASLNYQVDGYFQADDVFRLSYSGLVLEADGFGAMSFPLPTQPIGLPRNRSFEVFPPANRGGVQSSMFRPIGRDEVQYVRSIPGLKRVYYYIDNGKCNFIDNFGIIQFFTTLNMSVYTSGANNLDDNLNLPDDMISAIKQQVLAELRPMISLTDTIPLPASDAPEGRGL